jgi:hypothetical protein
MVSILIIHAWSYSSIQPAKLTYREVRYLRPQTSYARSSDLPPEAAMKPQRRRTCRKP